MKLRRALAILILLAVAILPVAAAPAVVTGDVYAGAMWDMAQGFNGYADMNVYIKAQVDDFNYVYVNFGRALMTYSAAFNATANSAYEVINNQYMYATTDWAKFFALDKALVGTLTGGFYYYGTAAYSSKLAAAWPRIGYRTTANNWVLMAQVGVPALAGVRLTVAPVIFTAAGAPYAFSYDFAAVPYLNLKLSDTMTANVDLGYFQGKRNLTATTNNLGYFDAEGDFTMTAGMLKIEAGAGIELDLATNGPFQYCVTGRGTFYLDDKKVTFVQGAAGVRGTFTSTAATTFPLDRVEINFQGTFLPLVDILECVTLDLSSTTAPFRSADTCFRFNLGVMDLNVGYLYGNNAGAVWGSQNLPANTTTGAAGGGAYCRLYWPF